VCHLNSRHSDQVRLRTKVPMGTEVTAFGTLVLPGGPSVP